MRKLAAPFLTIVSTLLMTQSAHTASSDWHDLGGGSARLIAVLDPETKRVDAALEVKLKEGWSTYWRYPGSSGIPPRFDFSNSRGFLVEDISYPIPSIMSPEDNPYAGYKGEVTFPLSGRLDLSQEAEIHLELLIGVCATVCIPAQASFSIETKDLLRSDPFSSQKIELARQQVPKRMDADQVLVEKSIYAGNQLHVTVNHDGLSTNPDLFVEGPMGWYLTPAKLKKLDNGKAHFLLDISDVPDGTDILATPLTYTLSNKSSGIEFVD